MTPRLTIHIGVEKTGTSAIQTFLKTNSERLRRQGIVVPNRQLEAGGPVDGHQVWYFADKGRAPAENAAEVAAKIADLFSSDGTRQVVISAESLTAHGFESFRLFERLGTAYETEVVVYLRRQDDLLLAAWQQWWGKVQTDFWAWLVAFVGVYANWQALLQNWESVVGRERMRVNLYERERLANADSVADFSRFLLADTSELEPAGETVNPSFNEAIVDLVPGGGFFEGPHDNAFYAFLNDLLGESSHKKSNESRITFAQRRAILNRYKDTNAWVRETYFAARDVPETLFAMPRPGDYVVPSPDDLRREQIQLVARLVFELSKTRK